MAGKTFFSEQNGTTNSQEIMNFSSSTSDLSGTLSNTNLPAPAPAPAVASYAYGLSIFLTLLILLVAFGGGVLFCVLMKRRRTKAQELESLDEAPIDEQIMTKEERIANELHLPLKKIKPQADDEIEDVAEQQTKPEKAFYIVSRVLALCVLMYLFFCTLSLLGSGFQCMGAKATSAINAATENPIAGFMAGVFLTVLLQSSSTTTSIVVTLCTTKILLVSQAVYVIFGANIGTSITSSLMALAHVNNRVEFARSFAGATVHDIFNLLSVAVIFPVEVVSQFLSRFTLLIVSGGNGGSQGFKFTSPIKAIVSPLTSLLISIDKKLLTDPNAHTVVKGGLARTLIDVGWSDAGVAALFVLIGVVSLSVTLLLLVKLLKATMKGKVARAIVRVLDYNQYVAILVGLVLTVAVQSSSIVTSTLVPLIGIGVITIENAFPVTIGSNLGTTCTSFLASLGADNLYGFQISLVHLLFNLIGMLVWFPLPFMRKVPLTLAKRLGLQCAKRRWVGFTYILCTFFVVPGLLLALSFGPTVLFWVVVTPLMLMLLALIIYELIRSVKPLWLPEKFQTYGWLPRMPTAPSGWKFAPFWCPMWCREDVDDTEFHNVFDVPTLGAAEPPSIVMREAADGDMKDATSDDDSASSSHSSGVPALPSNKDEAVAKSKAIPAIPSSSSSS